MSQGLRQPGLALRVGHVSAENQKGRHTTTTARLIKLSPTSENDSGGYVVDTPGIRELGLWEVNPDNLDVCFPEFRELIGDCRFTTCTHTHEPECAIRDAAVSGQVSRARYDSYRNLFAEATA